MSANHNFDLRDLRPEIRNFMIEEIDRDIYAGQLYISNRLTSAGARIYPELLLDASRTGYPHTLAEALKQGSYLLPTETRRTRSGVSQVKVPFDAHETLAEGEFNRFYIRAVCRYAIVNKSMVQVYRAKPVLNARSESQRRIGQMVDPHALLRDLRGNPGVDTALGLPPGPNSGLSVHCQIQANSSGVDHKTA